MGEVLFQDVYKRQAHEELGRLAAESDLYCLVTYGENAKRTAVVAAAKGCLLYTSSHWAGPRRCGW